MTPKQIMEPALSVAKSPSIENLVPPFQYPNMHAASSYTNQSSFPLSPYGFPLQPTYPSPYGHMSPSINPYLPFYPSSTQFPAPASSGFPAIAPSGFPATAFPGYPHHASIPDQKLSLETQNLFQTPAPILPSSPIESGEQSEYICWHISRQPKNKIAYLKALQILESRHYDLQIIQQWKGVTYESKWEQLGIEPGIGIRIARDLSTWAKLPKKIGPSTPISQDHQTKNTSLFTSSTRQNTSNTSQLQQPPTISRVLAKLAEQKQISTRSLESESEFEETEEDLDFGYMITIVWRNVD